MTRNHAITVSFNNTILTSRAIRWSGVN